MKKFRFYTRKNVFDETSVFSPLGNLVDEFENRERALQLVRELNKFLKLVKLYR